MPRALLCHLKPVTASLFLFFEIVAHSAPTPTEDPLEKFSIWSKSFDVRLGMGYKDNVDLSSVNPQGRAFVGIGGEAFLLRLAADGTQFYFFLSGEDMEYLNREPVDSERTLIAVAQWKKEFA